MTDVDITYDQGDFDREKDLVDWGVLVTEGQGGITVCVVALDPPEAATLLRNAADAIDAKAPQ